eukprot:GILJ01002156.1.p1 GENE.GILJ01002156.1~~GILJ01002156.1.p1  ORF type:complete len:500 (-),score=87.01 GILJ01002156.1:330-1829(-)
MDDRQEEDAQQERRMFTSVHIEKRGSRSAKNLIQPSDEGGFSFEDSLQRAMSVKVKEDLGLDQLNLNKSQTAASEGFTRNHIPWDWTLKTSIRIETNMPVDWSMYPSAEAECLALKDFVQNTSSATAFPHLELAILWQQGLLSWCFPSVPPPPDGSKAPRKSITGGDFLNSSKFKDWIEAFRSIYYQLRSNTCPFFYYRLPRFTILFAWHNPSATPPTWGSGSGATFASAFGGPSSSSYAAAAAGVGVGVGGTGGGPSSSQPVAIISRSTKGLRQLLDSAGITYTAPLLAEQSEPVDGFEDEPLDVEGIRVVSRSGGAASNASSPSSLLYCLGYAQVHALFDFLCATYSKSLADIGELPLLISPQPFLNASLRAAQITYIGPVQSGSRDDVIRGSSEKRLSNRVQIEGWILPSSVNKLLQTLDRTGGSWQSRFGVDPNGTGLNGSGLSLSGESDRGSDASLSFGTSYVSFIAKPMTDSARDRNGVLDFSNGSYQIKLDD